MEYLVNQEKNLSHNSALTLLYHLKEDKNKRKTSVL